MTYKTLFTPLSIGNCEIKNRIVMPPMMMGFGRFDGTPTDEMTAYYEERAKGGAGLIVTEITRVNDITGAAAFNQLAVSRDTHIEPLKKLAEKIHAHGAKFFVQLHHPGRQNVGLAVGTIPLCTALDKLTPAFGKLFFKLAPAAGQFLLKKNIVPASAAPSKVKPSYFSGGRVRALRHGEIKKLINDFIDGAERVKKAGCDGVYIHAAHGYLIQQFLSPYTNKRTDEYGGSLENRMRFAVEIVKGIKERCGDFPVVVRLSVDEMYDRPEYKDRYGIDPRKNDIKPQENNEKLRDANPQKKDTETLENNTELRGTDTQKRDTETPENNTELRGIDPRKNTVGYTLSEGVEMAKIFEKIGADAIDVSCAAYDTFNYWLEPSSFKTGWRTDMIKAVKNAVKIPVVAVNLLRTPQDAEKQLADGVSDFAALGRPHIADPYFAAKAASGRENEIKRCICCLYCFESMQKNAFVGKNGECAVNMSVGRENQTINRDGGGRRVVVVGAGAAGLTAAELLAKRGFKVVVYEKENRAGGQAALAANEKEKERIGQCIADLEYAAKLNGAEIRFNTEATPEIIKRHDPYAVVIASGGKPIIPQNIGGIDPPFTRPSTEVFNGKFSPKSQKIAVIGSGMTGLDAALVLAKNNSVSVIEMADSPAPGMWMQHADDVIPKLKALGVKIFTNRKLIEIQQNKINQNTESTEIQKSITENTRQNQAAECRNNSLGAKAAANRESTEIQENQAGNQNKNPGAIIVEDTKTKEKYKIEADAVVIAMGVKPENSLYDQIKNDRERVFLVGDAKKSGRIADATHSAFDAVNMI
ncbi:MAG: NAD(P)/FAD-dependent oxidoreductase [Clostridiales bacterium]|jgi:2,4-dienoyl-CoA reductase-like NADH-dependent reductase (Old Yellow Enzyme family)/thioredoxin reductase|nr:NAD(P)/FAD-dependent oxidoreductase [Clostridiales bacterium]